MADCHLRSLTPQESPATLPRTGPSRARVARHGPGQAGPGQARGGAGPISGDTPGSGYRGAVISASYRDFLVAVASSAGALTGLLFVAISVVTPRREVARGPRIIQQVRAAAAMVAFFNALAVSLFGLVPGTNIGYPAVVLAVIGLFFTAASTRSVRTSASTGRQQRQQLDLMVLLFAIFGTEFGAAIALLVSPWASAPADVVGYTLVASIIVGVSRAWEFVGDIDTGLSASLTVLFGHRGPDTPADDTAQDPPAPAGGEEPGIV